MAVRGHLGVRHRRGQPGASHAAQRPVACPERPPGRPHGTGVLRVRLAVHRPAHPPAPPARGRDPPHRPDDGRCGRLALQAGSPVCHRWRSPFRVAVGMPPTRNGVGRAHRPTGRSIRNLAAPPPPDRRCRRRGRRRRARRYRPRPSPCPSQRLGARIPRPPDPGTWHPGTRPTLNPAMALTANSDHGRDADETSLQGGGGAVLQRCRYRRAPVEHPMRSRGALALPGHLRVRLDIDGRATNPGAPGTQGPPRGSPEQRCEAQQARSGHANPSGECRAAWSTGPALASREETMTTSEERVNEPSPWPRQVLPPTRRSPSCWPAAPTTGCPWSEPGKRSPTRQPRRRRARWPPGPWRCWKRRCGAAPGT
jgi:hypothetical protein